MLKRWDVLGFSLRKTKYGISTKSKNIHRKSLKNMESYCYTLPKIGQLIIILERMLWHGIYLAVYCAYVECSCMLLGTSFILYGCKRWVRNTLRVSKKRALRRWSYSRMKTLHNDYLHDFYSISDFIRMIKSQVWNPQCMWPSWVIQEMHTKYDSQNLHRRKQMRYLNWLLTLECNFEIGSGFAGVGQTFRCVLPLTDVQCILVVG
jgi:hypothetical protein